jgi:hypothetical protein
VRNNVLPQTVFLQHPRLSELNPSDFYMWGDFTTLVCSAATENEENLRHILDSCRAIRNTEGPLKGSDGP